MSPVMACPAGLLLRTDEVTKNKNMLEEYLSNGRCRDILEYFDTSLKNVWKQWSVYNYKKYNK